MSDHFYELLHRKVQLVPDNVALVYEQQRISYAQLLRRVAAVAQQLLDAGVKAGDKIAILFPNHPDYVASFFAAAGIGATIVPVNPLLKSDEIAHILSDSDSKTLIVHEHSLGEALKSQQTQRVLERIFVSYDAAATAESNSSSNSLAQTADKSSISSGSMNLRLSSAEQHQGIPEQEFRIEQLSSAETDAGKIAWHKQINPHSDLALLVYTSGTTGKPKGAMLTHHSMLSIFPQRFDMFDVGEQDRTLATLPMCHIYGIAVLMIGTLSRGARLIMIPRFDAVGVLTLIEKEGITLVPAVPAMFNFLLMELEKKSFDLSSVRICFSGAAPLPLESIKAVERTFDAVLIEGFGMTETSCVATINPLYGTRKVGSVGPALPGVELKVIADDGRELGPGAENVGELWIKGPNIMCGYYKQEDATSQSIQDGWFASGDLCYKDEDGYIFIVGRKKEMIIRGGANIYPREIEEVLAKLEGIAESAVVGVPDKFMGERVKAVVVLKAGYELSETQIKEFCMERLAEYKVPRIIEFRTSLPRNSTGKILKRLLTESAICENNM